jgi:multidrug resistance efflux pump
MADASAEPASFAARDRDADPSLDDYPFGAWYWHPLADAHGKPFAGLLIARATPLEPGEVTRVARVADTAGHAWRALKGPRPVRRIRRLDRRQRRALMFATAVLAIFPVRLSALAPVEVVADRPYTLSAPFAGLVQRLEVAPNEPVRKGQPLVRFDDVRPRNELTLATERLAVARARTERASSVAFGSAEASRDIAIMQAERDLAQAEHDYARDVLAQSVLRAPRDGIAIYSDRRDFEGRAVNVGDPILQIADPSRVRFRVDLPAREQLSLSPGVSVKVWLDGQPLWAVDARLETASYAARNTADGVMAFALIARPVGATPDIGARGTARVEGRWVPLLYALLRRPITAARQTIGF